MAHTYTPVTRADRTYIPVSDVTPFIVGEQFTWANIAGWTWADLYDSGKIRWVDWLYGINAYTSITRADRTYKGVTK